MAVLTEKQLARQRTEGRATTAPQTTTTEPETIDIRARQSEIEREAEAAKATVREVARRERKARELPLKPGRTKGIAMAVAEVETARKEAHATGKVVTKAIGKVVAEHEKQIESIAKYKSGEGYDLVMMIQDGYTPKQLTELGFASDVVTKAQDRVAELTKADKYKGTDGYDLVAMVNDGWTQTQLEGLFGKDTAGEAITRADVIKRADKYKSDTGYDVAAMVRDNFPASNMALLFESPTITQAQHIVALDSYKSGDGYDLMKIMEDSSKVVTALGGNSDTDLPNLLIGLGFTEASIKEAEDTYAAVKKLAPYKNTDGTYDVVKIAEAVNKGTLDASIVTMILGANPAQYLTVAQVYQIQHAASITQAYMMGDAWGVNKEQVDQIRDAPLDTGDKVYVYLQENAPSAIELTHPSQLPSFQQSPDWQDLASALKDVEPYKMEGGQYDVGKAYQAIVDGKLSRVSFVTMFGNDTYNETKALYNEQANFKVAVLALEPFKTKEGTYNLPAAIEAGTKDTKVEDAVKLVFTPEQVSNAETVNKALAETKDFWNKDGSFQLDKYLRFHPDDTDTLHTLGFSDKQIKEATEFNSQPLSAAAFVQQYFADRGWKFRSTIIRALESTAEQIFKPEEHKEDQAHYQEAKRAYVAKYGKAAWYKSAGVEVASMAIPAMRALYPEVKLSDITGVEWAFTALVPLSIATGGLSGVVGGGVGAASIALRTASTLAGAGVTSLMGYATVANWKNMENDERAIMVGLTALGAFGTIAQGRSVVRSIRSYITARPVINAATNAGRNYTAMVKATRTVKANPSTTNLTRLEKVTKASIAADLKFLDKFSEVTQITAKQLARIEKVSRMPGLSDAISNLVKEHRTFETVLNSMKKTPITPAQAARLTSARNAYFKALDKFSDIAQPRYMGWRVPAPERTIIEVENTPLAIASKLQAEWDAVAIKLGKTKAGSPEYMRLIDKQEAMIKRSYEILSEGQDVSPELLGLIDEINRFNKERIEISPPPWRGLSSTRGGAGQTRLDLAERGKGESPLPKEEVKAVETKTNVALAERVKVENPLPDVVVGKEEVKAIETKTKITTEPATKATPTKAPGEITRLDQDILYGKGHAATRVAEQGITVAIGTVLQSVTGKSQPATAKDWNTYHAIERITRSAVRAGLDASTQNVTSTQLEELVATDIKQGVSTITDTKLQTQLQTQVKPITKVVTGLVTKVATEYGVPPEKPVRGAHTAIIKPPKAKAQTDKEGRPIYPEGTVVFKMGKTKRGAEFKAMLPPYDQDKLVSSRKPPVGMKRTEGTPEQTLTVIGGGKLPFGNLSADIGITDVFVDTKHRKIRFAPGLHTNVGKRIPSNTRGVSLANNMRVTRQGPIFYSQLRGQRGVTMSRHNPRRRRGRRI